MFKKLSTPKNGKLHENLTNLKVAKLYADIKVKLEGVYAEIELLDNYRPLEHEAELLQDHIFQAEQIVAAFSIYYLAQPDEALEMAASREKAEGFAAVLYSA